MPPEHWKQLTHLAQTQYGLVSVAQVLGLGASYTSLKRAIGRGLLVPARRSVLAVAGTPAAVWQPLMAAYLAAGADDVVVSHKAAAGLHRLPGILPGTVELTSLSGRDLRLKGVTCHSTVGMAGGDVVTTRGFRATSPGQTLIDLAGMDLDRGFLARIVADSCRRRLCSTRELERRLVDGGGRGRPGTEMLRSILAARAGGDSGLEDRWLRILASAGLRPPALQHQLVVGGRVLVLDFAWPALRVGVEVDGWDVHREREVWDHDHDKVNAYLEAGWRVLFVTSRTPPDDVVRQLRTFIPQKWTRG